jgi:hypothetical protein
MTVAAGRQTLGISWATLYRALKEPRRAV